MRIDDERIGKLDAVLRPALLLADPRWPRVGGVDVHPGARFVCSLGKPADRIDGRERRGPDRRNDGSHVVEPQIRIDPHAQLVVHRRFAQLHPEHARRLVDGRVGVLGADDDIAAGHVAGGDQRREGRGRRGVLDVTVPPVGKSEQLPDPVHNA